VDFAQLVKIYDKDKEEINGSPDFDKIRTSLVERSNLTLRM
jgi:hypothetical protein